VCACVCLCDLNNIIPYTKKERKPKTNNERQLFLSQPSPVVGRLALLLPSVMAVWFFWGVEGCHVNVKRTKA